MALLDYTRQQRQINFELRVVDVFRKLAIKVDNAFIFYNNTKALEPFTMTDLKAEDLTPHDRYIIHQTRLLIDTVDKAFHSRRLYDATEALRAYTYDILCGIYVEFVKADVSPVESGETRTSKRRDTAMTLLHTLLDILLRLLHPFMPFHSEGLWQELSPETRALVDEATIMTATWPTVAEFPKAKDAGGDEMEKVLELLDILRAWKGESGVVVPPKGRTGDFVRSQWVTIQRMGKVKNRLRIAGETEDFGKEVGWICEK
jgi:valyl-tRNA synthetase